MSKIRNLLAVLCGIVMLSAHSVFISAQDVSSGSIGRAEFLNSLSDAERKVPLQLVVQMRLARGEPVPAVLAKRAERSRSQINVSSDVYKISGETAETVAAQIRSVGVVPIFISSSRPYATAPLSPDQLMVVVAHPGIHSAMVVAPPQAQGFFEAYDAHIGSGSATGVGSETWDAANLTGQGVVVAIVSRPVKATDLNSLDDSFILEEGGVASRVIPPADRLKQWPGVVNNNFGSDDLLALLQIVYKFAPGATIVIGSPFTEVSVDGVAQGLSSAPGQLAELIVDLATGDDGAGIPAANIIIDDLFYATQNPFEYDEVSEAIQHVRGLGALYITAAGDHGHLDRDAGLSTSSTHISQLQRVNSSYQVEENAVWAVHNEASFGANIHAFVDSEDKNIGFAELDQDLSDLCLFWDQKPSPNLTYDDPFVYVYSAANEELEWWAPFGPGGCLNGGDSGAKTLPAGSKVVLEWFGSESPNILLQGLGAEPGTPAFTFDGVTDGGIRGHASSPDAITVSAATIDTAATRALYAQWVEQTILKFDLQDGTWDSAPQEIAVDSDGSYFFSDDAGKQFTLPAESPAKAGATFVEWNLSATRNPDDPDAAFNPGDEFTMPAAGEGPVTLYAIWATAGSAKIVSASNAAPAATVTVTYDLQGGTGGPDPLIENVDVQDEFTVSAVKPTKTNFTFQEWNTTAVGDGTTYSPGEAFEVQEALTLYAQWQQNQVTVTLEAPDAEWPPGLPVPALLDAGEDFTFPATGVVTKDGRLFLGWNTQRDGSGTLFSAGETISVPDLGVVEGEITYYAQWNAYPFTLTFDLQGGEPDTGPTSQGSVFGDDLTLDLAATPTKPGYRFDGWNTQADGAGQTYEDGGTYPVPERVAAEGYSSGGQRVFQYEWQDVGVGDAVDYVPWQGVSTDGNRPRRKPNVAAVGSGHFVTLDGGGQPTPKAYAGTSHAAAAVAGVSALLWEYRASEIATEHPGLAQETVTKLLNEEVRAAIRDSAQYGGADPYVPTSPFDLTSSLLLGDGAIDATAVLTEAFFDEPLTINDISNVEGVGAVELSFTKTLDDLDEAFVYWVECQGLLEPLDPDLEEIPTPNAAYILPSDSGQALGGIAGFTPAIKSVDKAPLVRDAAPGSEVVCSITPRASAELWTPSILTMTALVPIDASPATLTMSEKALGIDLLVTDDSEYPAGTQVTHTASCKDDAGTEVWSGELIEGVPQSIPSNPRAQLTCISTSSVKYKTATAIEKQSEPAKASATDVSAPTVTLTPDMGGVLVSWVVDVNLASAISQSLSLVCTQAGTEFFNKEMEAGATEYFVEASDDAPVECIISSTMSADGLTTVTIEGSGDATPEPMSSGLPIWLLYQAAQ